MRTRRASAPSKRRAISGIVAALLLFTMLFTVGGGYFLWVNTLNGTYSKALATRGSSVQDQLLENLVLNTATPETILSFTVANQGGLAANVTKVFVQEPSGKVSTYGAGLNASSTTTPALPLVVSQGGSITLTIPGMTVRTGTYTIKVLTQRGSTFTTTYPPPLLNLGCGPGVACSALTSGAIGDLYLNFHSYTAWNVTRTGCSSANDSSGWCLSQPKSAFTLASSNYRCAGSGSTCTVFSLRVTNLNQQEEVIILDQYSLLYQLYPQANNGKAGITPWFIVSNSSNTIQAHYHPIYLYYNQPQTLVFATSVCIPTAESSLNPGSCNGNTAIGSSFKNWQAPALFSQSPSICSIGSPCYQQGVDFIMPHGWEFLPTAVPAPAKLTFNAENYGQNLPFYSTLYR